MAALRADHIVICHLLRSSRQKGRSEHFLFILDEGSSRKHALDDTLAYAMRDRLCVIGDSDSL